METDHLHQGKNTELLNVQGGRTRGAEGGGKVFKESGNFWSNIWNDKNNYCSYMFW